MFPEPLTLVKLHEYELPLIVGESNLKMKSYWIENRFYMSEIVVVQKDIGNK